MGAGLEWKAAREFLFRCQETAPRPLANGDIPETPCSPMRFPMFILMPLITILHPDRGSVLVDVFDSYRKIILFRIHALRPSLSISPAKSPVACS
jgi:hypothetical protein